MATRNNEAYFEVFKTKMGNGEQILRKIKPDLVKPLNKDVSIINWLQIKLSLKQY